MITLACSRLAGSLQDAPETDLRPAPAPKKRSGYQVPGFSREVRWTAVRRSPGARPSGQPEVSFWGLIDQAVGRRAIRAAEFESSGV